MQQPTVFVEIFKGHEITDFAVSLLSTKIQ